MPDREGHDPVHSQLRHREGYVEPTAEQRLAAGKARAEARANSLMKTEEDVERAVLVAEINKLLVLEGKGPGSAVTIAEIVAICQAEGLDLILPEYEAIAAGHVLEPVDSAGD